jgi:hypothetical protein
MKPNRYARLVRTIRLALGGGPAYIIATISTSPGEEVGRLQLPGAEPAYLDHPWRTSPD